MPLRELRRVWAARRQSRVAGGESDPESGAGVVGGQHDVRDGGKGAPLCSLPLLQVWPSQESPRGEADGQSFVFPSDDGQQPRDLNQNDSGIDSVQASPSPGGGAQCCEPTAPFIGRRFSSALLHPDHARLLRRPSSPTDQDSFDEGEFPLQASNSSSTASSMNSVAAAVTAIGARQSDLWERDRRRSSTMTARYSLLDALDLEYALIRAAARGSVGPYSLSESLHKLTFTQSLAFPALARGLAGKRRRSSQMPSARGPIDPSDSGLNAFAKIVTALVLMLVSVMVFGVVYKFVRT